MNVVFKAFVFFAALLIAPAGSGVTAPAALDECPKLLVDCPDEIPRGGRTYTVNLHVYGVDPKRKLTYKWSVSKGGEIVEGQGTPVLKVRCTHPEETITTTVEVSGLPDPCGNTASCSFSVS